MTLKLYVWEDVLNDYTSGMAVALAESKEEALRLLAKKVPDYGMEELRARKPSVRRAKCAFYVYGGG